MVLRSVALVLSLLAHAAWAATPASLCEPASEHAVFQCRSGKKLIAVCAPPGWERSGDHLQYRFGTVGHVELRVPDASGTGPAQLPKVGLITLSGGGGVSLRFQAGKYSYTVYSATSASSGDKAGVVVKAADKQVAHVPCKGPQPMPDLNADALLHAGLPQDVEPFDLP